MVTVSARPRILEVLYSFGVGGSEIVGLELARQLVSAGADVLCAAIDPKPGPLIARCEAYGIQVVDLRMGESNWFVRNGLSGKLERTLKGLHLDAIHLQHFVALNKLGLPARIAGVRRIVVTEHSVWDVDQSFGGRLRARLNWRLADTVAVVHSGIKDYLCDHIGIREDRVEVIPIGVDVDQYGREGGRAVREELGLGKATTFVFVGRVAPVKDVPGLIRAFLNVVDKRGPVACLLVVGDGEEAAQCRRLIAEHPLGKQVTMVGQQNDIRPYLAASDVFVLNSRSEGTPRALLEAMATGLPGVCPAVGAISGMLQDRGWLTIPGDAVSLEKALCSALDDLPGISAKGIQCRTFVRERYNSEIGARRYWELLVGA